MDLSNPRPANVHRLTVDVDGEIYSAVSRLHRKFQVPKTRVLRELLRIGINNANA